MLVFSLDRNHLFETQFVTISSFETSNGQVIYQVVAKIPISYGISNEIPLSIWYESIEDAQKSLLHFQYSGDPMFFLQQQKEQCPEVKDLPPY